MQLLNRFNPTRLAELQDVCIGSIGVNFKARSKDFVSAYIKELEKFNLLLSAGDLVGTLPKNNLQIRQWLVLGALNYLMGKAYANYARDALNLFQSLKYSNGMYSEGYSYFRYVESAFKFFFSITDDLEFKKLAEVELKMCAHKFIMLTAPDLTIPTNDTWYDPSGSKEWLPNHSSDSFYSVYRRNGNYLMIVHNSEILKFRKNDHVAPDFGHFVLWADGHWVVSHPWYIGYSKKKARSGQERDYLNVPKGKWNEDFYWRYFSKPRLRTIHRHWNQIELIYNEKFSRIFDIDEDRLLLTDYDNGKQINRQNFIF